MKKKVCFVATLELSVKVFLTDHMRLLQEDYDLSVIVNTENTHFLDSFDVRATVIPVQIERKISPLNDLKCLIELHRIFRREKFDILHSIMPKSGFLSMVAGLFARIPVRVHTFTGQFWKNDSGVKRFIFKNVDKLLAMCATNVLVDSPSQRDFLIGEGVIGRKKSSVIGKGSMCGVDVERFHFDEEARRRIRETYGIAPDETVFLFLGRMNRDKGVLDLARAFASLCGKFEGTRLLLAGPDEDDVVQEVLQICDQCLDRVHIQGFTDVPEKLMSAADVFCLPSYREGFGLVIAEAAAVGIPSIGSRIYGITDTIDDEVTGFFSEPSAHYDLMLKMSRFVEDKSLIRSMGDKARARTLEKYSKDKVVAAMREYYKRLERSL